MSKKTAIIVKSLEGVVEGVSIAANNLLSLMINVGESLPQQGLMPLGDSNRKPLTTLEILPYCHALLGELVKYRYVNSKGKETYSLEIKSGKLRGYTFTTDID